MPGDGVPAFHVMAKPAGARCNCACDYCFYLPKARLYPGSASAMPDEVHRAYIEQLFAAHRTPEVTVAWQGGEPTLMGLDFFRRSVAYQLECARPGTRIENTFQTNGLLLDDDWCRFFAEHGFLVGLSMDGPKDLHDVHRRDAAGRGTFDRVLSAARLLQAHGVEYNILCTVNSINADRPLEVYRFFRDELGARYVQFVPVAEREGAGVTAASVRPDQWGRFLIAVFDEWVARDVGEMFVLNFDGALAGWLGRAGTVCVFGPTCGLGVALEHNGDVYSCDHFVDPDHYLGNILETPLADLVASARQRAFGRAKQESLPSRCRACGWLAVCNGECPKNRFASAGGETGLNDLCDGYRAFFSHADPAMRRMADLIRRGRPADGIMAPGGRGAKPGRNDPCFCGSGLKFKRCHGRRGGHDM
jgi:uncharacterized protein